MFTIKEGCPGCGACMSACPVKAIKIDKGKASIQQDKCIKCGVCVSYCPVKLISEQKGKTPSQGEEKVVKKTASAAKEVGTDAK
jgi:NAD-dependent dihydropyrimidine dehydrogenase PreA subunit